MRLLLVLSLLLAPLIAPSQTLMPPGTPATPNSECGATGVGYDPLSRGVVAMSSPGYRVDERGNWVQCNRPCIGDSKPREWTVDGATCTTASTRGYSGVDDPRLDRVLLHGTYGHWRANDHAGLLIERCDDGQRVLIYASCSAPPTPPETPPAPSPVASAPAPVDQGCSGTVRSSGLTAVVPRRLAEGESTTVRLGLRYVPVWCRDGKLTFEAPALSAEQAASAADEWRSRMGR